MARVPEAWRGRVEREYARRMARVQEIPAGRGRRTKAEQAANAWLCDVSRIFEQVRFAPGVTEGDIRDKAAECAAAAWSLAEIVPGVMVNGIGELRARLAGYVETFGVVPPGEKIKDGPAVSRMTSPLWWRRALRVAQARQLERGAITLGYVHRKAEIYASDSTVQRRAEQRRRNAEMLEQTQAENLDTGDVFTLAQLAAASVANPSIRRGELMTRISGFEAVARGLGHVAEFVTLTAPSRFHRMRKAASGYIEQNPRHDGSSPRDAQKYLGRVWARFRAKLARMGMRVYGFRIAEPHHDACPHWHLLLFMPAWVRDGARSVPRFRAVFRRYALQDSQDEAGAKKRRITFEAIDWNKGSAAGYVAKYISKNVDGGGYQVQGDLESGKEAIYPGQRVEAWASTWGIRQFQQVGGPPVGVWRELRRMEQSEALPARLNSAIAAADCGKNGKDENGTAGNWRRYVELMGGPTAARADLPFRVAYRDKPGQVDRMTGEISKARTVYGDEAAPVPCGVRYWGQVQRVEGIAVYLAAVELVAESKRARWAIKRGSDAGESSVFFVGAVGGGVAGGGCKVGRAGVRIGGSDAGRVAVEGFSGVGAEGGNVPGRNSCGSGGAAPVLHQAGVAGNSRLVGGWGFEDGEAGRTRTRVNNCTEGGEDDGGNEGKTGGSTGKGGGFSPAFAGNGKARHPGDGGERGSAGA